MEDLIHSLKEQINTNGKKVLILAIFVCMTTLILSACSFGKKDTEDEDLAYLPKMEDVNNIKTAKEEDDEDETTEIDVIGSNDEKMVSVAVETTGRSNPFLPESEAITDRMRYGFDLMAPPDSLSSEDSEGAKIVTTKVSGIMFDIQRPSAILNIEGTDYLVRPGDYINNYKILSVGKDIVTVQLGKNVYKAKVGEIITEGELNYNTIDHLDKKFGGAKK